MTGGRRDLVRKEEVSFGWCSSIDDDGAEMTVMMDEKKRSGEACYVDVRYLFDSQTDLIHATGLLP